MLTWTKTMVAVESDPSKTLAEWKDQIDELVKRYGPDAVMMTSAGYNNVELVVETKPAKRQKKERVAP